MLYLHFVSTNVQQVKTEKVREFMINVIGTGECMEFPFVNNCSLGFPIKFACT